MIRENVRGARDTTNSYMVEMKRREQKIRQGGKSYWWALGATVCLLVAVYFFL